jgi:hypothetical protein
MPDAQCTRSLVRKGRKHTSSHHRLTGIIRHSLRNGFNGLFRALPGDRAFFVTIASEKLASQKTCTPASGRQDHTALPSATSAFDQRAFARLTPLRPPHPTPTSVTIMIRPSGGVGWRRISR